jgi:hypothetical protein
MCWEWYRGGTERVDEVEVCEAVGLGDERNFEVKEEEVVEKREGRWRDEWECDFCGVECFCKFQRFSEVE